MGSTGTRIWFCFSGTGLQICVPVTALLNTYILDENQIVTANHVKVISFSSEYMFCF